MNILSFLGGAVKPLTEMVDKLHTSEEERLSVQTKIIELQNSFAFKALEYEQSVTQMRTDIIKAEAGGQSWLQRNWRPIVMLTFTFLVVGDSYGWLPNRLSPDAFALLKLGLGGYVIGRSAEKIAPSVARAIGERKKVS